MRERFGNAYRVQETRTSQNVALEYPQRPFNLTPQGRGTLTRGGFGRGGSRGSIVCYNCGQQGHFAQDFVNLQTT